MTMETLTTLETHRHDVGKKRIISDRALIFYHIRLQRRGDICVTYTEASFTLNSPFVVNSPCHRPFPTASCINSE